MPVEQPARATADKNGHALLRHALLAWYESSKRALPWRVTPPNAYHVWVSEIMLQQTQVATMLPYWHRFVARFPTVRSLAAASIDDVLAHWSGLGYYRRAHHLHAAARRVVGEHGGRIPDEAAELRALPGVGRYTAGAVASIAFGRREPVLDGNVARVLSRVFYGSDALDRRNGEAAGSAPNGTPKGREQARTAALWALAESLLPARRPGDFNQALMELGAQVCLPASPKCSACPIARRCAARACGAQHKALIATKRAARATMHVAALVVRRRGCVLLVRRPDGGLWSGLWELPCAVTDGGAVGEPQLRGMVDSMGMSGGAIEALGEVTRVLTHRIYRVKAFILHDPRGRIPRSGHYRWCDPDKPEVGIAGPSRRVLALLSTKLLRLPRKKG